MACAGVTPKLVRSIRDRYEQIPIIASGRPTAESIRMTIEAGAYAVTDTPTEHGGSFQEHDGELQGIESI